MDRRKTKQLLLPTRVGPKPDTTNRLPHSQLNQHGSDSIVRKLHTFCFSLPCVENRVSGVSVPGARALVLGSSKDKNCCLRCNPRAFMIGREFAHIHPAPDLGSMHVQLTAADARAVIESGWGESHYLVTQGHLPMGLIMVFSPRNEEELEVVKLIVRRSYEYASGALIY